MNKIVDDLRQGALLSLEELPSEYSVRRQVLSEFQHAMSEVILTLLEQPLNQHLSAMPHNTIAEKRQLAKWVNAELRHFGLTIRCPKTGRPAFLSGAPGNNQEKGRFQFEIAEQSGIPPRTVSSVELPLISIMHAPEPRFGLPGRSR